MEAGALGIDSSGGVGRSRPERAPVMEVKSACLLLEYLRFLEYLRSRLESMSSPSSYQNAVVAIGESVAGGLDFAKISEQSASCLHRTYEFSGDRRIVTVGHLGAAGG